MVSTWILYLYRILYPAKKDPVPPVPSLDLAGCEEFRAATSTNITVAPEEGG